MITQLRRHWLLVALMIIGCTLRLMAWLAYRPALLYIDSFRYLGNIKELKPDGLNPIGYDLILSKLLIIGNLQFVAALQHLLGVLLAVALYALARRHRVPRVLAAVVAAVVLLDAYQIQIEQNIMSEVWFQAFLVAVMWALLGRRDPAWWQGLLAGLLIGVATITRTIGIVAAVPVLVYLITTGGACLSWAGWRRILLRVAAAGAGLAFVIGSYASYYHSFTGKWGIGGAGTFALYGRTATFAQCDQLPLPGSLALFCPAEPVSQRKGVDWYAHQVYGNSTWPKDLPPGEDKKQLATEFGRIVLKNQPLDFADAVLKDFAKNFAPVKKTFHNDVPIDRWQFQTTYPRFPNADGDQQANRPALEFGGRLPEVRPGLAGFLRGYQLSIGYTSGPLLGLLALAGIGATFRLIAAGRSGLCSAAMLTTGSGLALLLGSAAFEFSWRYQLPGLVLLPLGGAIGLTALFGRTGSALEPFPDPVDIAAVAAFDEEYGPFDSSAGSQSVVVLMAAYNEEGGIGAVLEDLPDRCAELSVSVLVVVDGAADRTAEVAAEHGAFVCDVAQNRGQGAALRLGYHLAQQMGATYVVTTDADGQYDNTELPQLLQPLLDDEADFVTGSRRLGSEEADSRMRWIGVRLFAWLASLLTRQQITDTSFGFRAMRPARACSVRLSEPQYQASELLLGMLAGGARLQELPLSMRFRNNGTSKKGRALAYGANYGRVMISTWWRDYVNPSTRQRRTGRRGRTSQ